MLLWDWHTIIKSVSWQIPNIHLHTYSCSKLLFSRFIRIAVFDRNKYSNTEGNTVSFMPYLRIISKKIAVGSNTIRFLQVPLRCDREIARTVWDVVCVTGGHWYQSKLLKSVKPGVCMIRKTVLIFLFLSCICIIAGRLLKLLSLCLSHKSNTAELFLWNIMLETFMNIVEQFQLQLYPTVLRSLHLLL